MVSEGHMGRYECMPEMRRAWRCLSKRHAGMWFAGVMLASASVGREPRVMMIRI